MVIYYYLLFLISLGILFLTGHTIMALIDRKIKGVYTNTFFKLFLGLLGCISFYSLIKTSGITINIGIILIGLLYYFSTKQKINLKMFKANIQLNKTVLLPLISVVAFSSVYFFWKYYCLFNHGEEYPIVINSDSIYHSNLSIFLNEFGIESLNTNYFYPPDGTSPYHYFEGWTIAFFSYVFNLNHWITEECIVYPMLASIVVAGTWALFENFVILTNKNKLLGILTVFFSGFYIPQIVEGLSIFNYTDSYNYGYNAIDEFWGLKLIIAYILSIAGLLLLINKKIIHSVLVFLLLPIVSITLAPGILATTFTFLFLIILFKKKIKIDISIPIYSLLYPFIVGLFILSFYFFTGSKTEFITPPKSVDIINNLNSILAIKSKIVLFMIRILQLILLYSPVLILLLISYFNGDKLILKEQLKKLKTSFFLIILVTTISLMVWLTLSFAFVSKGYYFYPVLPFLNIISVVLIIVSLNNIKSIKLLWISRIVVCSAFCFFIFRTNEIYTNNKITLWDIYSKEYIANVNKECSKIKNKIGGKIEGRAFFDNGVYNDNIDKLGNYLSGFYPKADSAFVPTSLSSIDVTQNQLEKIVNKNYILKTPIYLFSNKLKKYNKDITNDQIRFYFIKKHKIEYLFLNKGIELAENLKPYLKKQIKDKKSGVTFILLDF